MIQSYYAYCTEDQPSDCYLALLFLLCRHIGWQPTGWDSARNKPRFRAA